MKALAITWTNVRRMLRERSNIFFVFIFPLALILLIGAQFGGGAAPVVGIYQADDGQLASDLAAAIEAEERLDTIIFEDSEELLAAVERGSVQAGVFLSCRAWTRLRPQGMSSRWSLSRVRVVSGHSSSRWRNRRFRG